MDQHRTFKSKKVNYKQQKMININAALYKLGMDICSSDKNK